MATRDPTPDDRLGVAISEGVLTLISLFTVVFTEEIPRPLFDVIVMICRYEWRAMIDVLFMHEDYPPFNCAA
jgi:hypothetical protein